MGLELKPNKTRLTHTLKTNEGETGFEFLGFHVQQHKVGKYRAATNKSGNLGFKTIIKPSKRKVKAHLRHIGDVIDAHKTAPQAALISKLNPIIRGWSNYYSTVVSKETFNKLDHLIYDKLRAWASYRGKNGQINKDKYWKTVGNQNWCFSTEDGLKLKTHAETPIIRHTKVKGECSPYNGDWKYWSKRKREYPGTPTRVAKLMKRQNGICPHCGLYFIDTDTVEVDHIIPTSLGGKNTYDNLQLLHKHCHNTKTTQDGSIPSRS